MTRPTTGAPLHPFEIMAPPHHVQALDLIHRLLREAYDRGRASAITDLNDQDRWQRWTDHTGRRDRRPIPPQCTTTFTHYLQWTDDDD